METGSYGSIRVTIRPGNFGFACCEVVTFGKPASIILPHALTVPDAFSNGAGCCDHRRLIARTVEPTSFGMTNFDSYHNHHSAGTSPRAKQTRTRKPSAGTAPHAKHVRARGGIVNAGGLLFGRAHMASPHAISPLAGQGFELHGGLRFSDDDTVRTTAKGFFVAMSRTWTYPVWVCLAGDPQQMCSSSPKNEGAP